MLLFTAPGNHVIDVPVGELPTIVTNCPRHIDVGVATAVTVGGVNKLTATVPKETQPTELVAATV